MMPAGVLACEHLALHICAESEALDIAVRNLFAEWRSDFRRLFEHDKSSSKGGTLPFKLALPQIATAFVECADEIGLGAFGSCPTTATSTRPSPTALMCRLETTAEEENTDGVFLPEEDVDFIVNAMVRISSPAPIVSLAANSVIPCQTATVLWIISLRSPSPNASIRLYVCKLRIRNRNSVLA